MPENARVPSAFVYCVWSSSVRPVRAQWSVTPLPPVYCGIFSVSPTSVAAQLVHVVVSVRVPCFASSAVCVAVDIGSSASVQSFGLLESETSAIRIISQVAGVTHVVSVGKSISDIVLI